MQICCRSSLTHSHTSRIHKHYHPGTISILRCFFRCVLNECCTTFFSIQTVVLTLCMKLIKHRATSHRSIYFQQGISTFRKIRAWHSFSQLIVGSWDDGDDEEDRLPRCWWWSPCRVGGSLISLKGCCCCLCFSRQVHYLLETLESCSQCRWRNGRLESESKSEVTQSYPTLCPRGL